MEVIPEIDTKCRPEGVKRPKDLDYPGSAARMENMS